MAVQTDPATPGPAPAQQDLTEPTRARALVGPAAGVCVGVGILLLAQTIEQPAVTGGLGPRWWPQVTGVLVLVLSLGAAARDGLAPDRAGEPLPARQPGGVRRVLLALAVVLAYGPVWYFVDFRVATLPLVAGLVAVGGGRGWKALVLLPVVVTALLWTLFGLLLQVPV